MKRLLSLLVVFIVCLVVESTAFAEVKSIYEEKTNWELTYPTVVVSDNIAVQNRINNDIMTYINDLRADFETGEYYTCGGNYQVHYEDNDILSISLCLYRYPYGANGNHSYSWDIVYDKKTGKKIPLYNYVHITPADLQYYKYYHTYSQSGELMQEIWDTDITEIPTNYFLPGNGSICLVFSPYTLAAGVFGSTYIELEPEYIEYLNRKNKK